MYKAYKLGQQFIGIKDAGCRVRCWILFWPYYGLMVIRQASLVADSQGSEMQGADSAAYH